MTDVRVGYQVVLYDKEGDTFRPANGNGGTAKVFATLWEAQDNIQSWGLMFHPSDNYYLGVQEVRRTLLTQTLRPTAEVRDEVNAMLQALRDEQAAEAEKEES